jgi:hypothetical protein
LGSPGESEIGGMRSSIILKKGHLKDKNNHLSSKEQKDENAFSANAGFYRCAGWVGQSAAIQKSDIRPDPSTAGGHQSSIVFLV